MENNLDKERGVTVPDLKRLAEGAFSRIQQDQAWTAHLFTVNKGRISGVVLHRKQLSTSIANSLSSGDSDNYYAKIDEVSLPPEKS